MTESSETAHDKFWNINLLLDCDCAEGAAAYRRLGGETLCNINKCTLGKNAFIAQTSFLLQGLLFILFLYNTQNIYALQQHIVILLPILWHQFSDAFSFVLVKGFLVLEVFFFFFWDEVKLRCISYHFFSSPSTLLSEIFQIYLGSLL